MKTESPRRMIIVRFVFRIERKYRTVIMDSFLRGHVALRGSGVSLWFLSHDNAGQWLLPTQFSFLAVSLHYRWRQNEELDDYMLLTAVMMKHAKSAAMAIKLNFVHCSSIHVPLPSKQKDTISIPKCWCEILGVTNPKHCMVCTYNKGTSRHVPSSYLR